MLKFLRIFGLAVAILIGLFIIERGIVPYFSSNKDEEIAQKQFDELVMPIVRIKGGVELPGGRQARWTGSGVIVYSKENTTNSGFDTYVLTCNHVVEKPVFAADSGPSNGPWGPPPKISGWTYGVDYVELFNPDGSSRKVQGYVTAQSNNNIFTMNEDGDLVVKVTGEETDEFGLKAGEDLALVRLETTEKLPTVKMMPRASIDKLRRFFGARVVGCSLGGRPYNTVGEITILQDDYMSVSAQFVPGNSGGAAYLDKTHEFLGITNAGPNGVWHMGLIRPLKRIYDWMDKGGYAFIYNPTTPDKIRIGTLAKDLDLHVAEETAEKNALVSAVRRLEAQSKSASQNIQDVTRKAEDLQKQVDFLTEKVAKLDVIRERVYLIISAILTGNSKTLVPSKATPPVKVGDKFPPNVPYRP